MGDEIWAARQKVATMRKEALDELMSIVLNIEQFAQRQITAGDDDEAA